MADPANPVAADEAFLVTDPTVCFDCRKDNGTKAFPLQNGRSLCGPCRSHRRRIQFPVWMRAASIACLLIGGWGFYRSIGHARGIYAYRMGVAAFLDERFSDAAEHLQAARKFMPDDEGFQDLEAYYRGYDALDQGNAKDAAHWFQVSLDLDPDSIQTDLMLTFSQRRVAFEAGQYDTYLHASQHLLELDDDKQNGLFMLAPALACEFAVTGREEFRKKALVCLEQAKHAGPGRPDDWLIEGWVKQILEKRTIVSFDDFWSAAGKNGSPDQDFG